MSGKKAKTLPGLGGQSHSYFIFSNNSELTFKRIFELLCSYYDAKGRDKVEVDFFNDHYLYVRTETGWCVHIVFNDAPSVAAEGKELSENVSSGEDYKAIIRSSSVRFELRGDDDPNYDMMNEPLFIIDQLVSIPGVIALGEDSFLTYPE